MCEILLTWDRLVKSCDLAERQEAQAELLFRRARGCLRVVGLWLLKAREVSLMQGFIQGSSGSN